MAKCPNCKKEVTRADKKWKYGKFSVQAYACHNCKTQFREYFGQNGKHSFTLRLKKGRGYIKA
jgi:transposase-like protein